MNPAQNKVLDAVACWLLEMVDDVVGASSVALGTDDGAAPLNWARAKGAVPVVHEVFSVVLVLPKVVSDGVMSVSCRMEILCEFRKDNLLEMSLGRSDEWTRCA